MAKQKGKKIGKFPVIHPNAAAIDIADKELVVAVSPDRSEENVKTFGSFTCDLYDIAKWLKSCGIDTVAMESTGIYWVQPFLVLQSEGLDPWLVNARQVKNVTGRKSDENDAMWIQRLHSCGLLSKSFQPELEVRGIRSLMRYRKSLVESINKSANTIQKELEQMNIKYHTVISDIQGKTGQKILSAIVNGQRDPEKLADLCDPRIKASREEVVKSLQGFWREEHILILSQQYDMLEYLRSKIKEIDAEIQKNLKHYIASQHDGEIPEDVANQQTYVPRNLKNQLIFNASPYLKHIYGVDVTAIDGIKDLTALTIFSEIGSNLNNWPSKKHFASWLGAAPKDEISGGKLLSSKTDKKKNVAGQAFKQGAVTLWRNKSPLGNFYRKIQSQAGPGKAVVATQRKLSVIFYTMVVNQQEYDPQALQKTQERIKEKKIKSLERQLEKLKSA